MACFRVNAHNICMVVSHLNKKQFLHEQLELDRIVSLHINSGLLERHEAAADVAQLFAALFRQIKAQEHGVHHAPMASPEQNQHLSNACKPVCNSVYR